MFLLGLVIDEPSAAAGENEGVNFGKAIRPAGDEAGGVRVSGLRVAVKRVG